MVEQMARGKNGRASGRLSHAKDDKLARLASEILTCAVALACQLDDAQELSRVSVAGKIPDLVDASGEFRAINTVGCDSQLKALADAHEVLFTAFALDGHRSEASISQYLVAKES